VTRASVRSWLTSAEYLAWEHEQTNKHEFHAGEVFAMAGGSPRHHWIAGNVQSSLKRALDDGCFTFTSDQRIMFDEGARYVYPDTSVVSGQILLHEGTTDVLVNPTILVEVLSSTDRRRRDLHAHVRAAWHLIGSPRALRIAEQHRHPAIV